MSNNITGTVSAGGAIFNDYVLKVEDIPGGHRLAITRGSEVQVVDIMDHDLTIDGGQPGQYIGYNEAGNAVPMDLPDTGVYYVHVAKDATTGKFVSDRTREEITEAYDAGRNVICHVTWGDGYLDRHVPLSGIIRDTYPNGTVLTNSVEFGMSGSTFVSVSIRADKAAYVDEYGVLLHADSAPVVFPPLSASTGKLIYVDANGALTPLQLGDELEIVAGELRVRSTMGVKFYDELGGKFYQLSVLNGELTMKEVAN